MMGAFPLLKVLGTVFLWQNVIKQLLPLGNYMKIDGGSLDSNLQVPVKRLKSALDLMRIRKNLLMFLKVLPGDHGQRSVFLS